MKVSYSNQRRTFLKTVALLGGAAFLSGVKEAGADRKPPAKTSENISQGYRTTEHIAKYYKSAQI